MPGTFIFKPIEANLTHNTDLIGKMNPYCQFKVGEEVIKSEVCKKGGKHPHWNDTIIIPLDQPALSVEVMDKDRITSDDHIGNFVIDLKEVQAQGRVSKWYPLTYKDKPAGEILMETGYQPENPFPQIPENIVAETNISATSTGPTTVVQEEAASGRLQAENVFVEQKQVVEPHVFTKSVDVVETRPVMKEIEVTEPVKVVKEVPYTEVVPVMKEVEVVEPQVVKKKVEVIEPRLVTKQIQVVENVPVTKEVEVIEPQTITKVVESFEPRTFTKQVEVVEQVPVKKVVETTEPVVVTKAVDFVEPVITTKTVTKELQQPIVVDEKITTTVGPATVVGVEATVKEKVIGQSAVATEAMGLGQATLTTETMGLTAPVIATQTVITAAQEPAIIDEKIATTTTTTIIEEEVGKEAIVDVEKETKVVSSKKRKAMEEGIQKGNLKQVKLNNVEDQIQEETKVTYTKEVKSAPKNVKKKKGT